MSQNDLAQKAGLTPRYVSRIENKAQNVTLDNLERLATALGIDVTELLGESEYRPTQSDLAVDTLDQAMQLLARYRSLL